MPEGEPKFEEDVIGSGDPKDWAENQEGVFEFQEREAEIDNDDFNTMFEKVIGGKSEEDEMEVREILEKNIEKPWSQEVKNHEILPTEKDKKIIKFSETAVDALVSFYGGKPKKIKTENICLVKMGAINDITAGKLRNGMYSTLGQRVIAERSGSDVQLTTTLAHELLHFKSYKAAQITSEGNIKPYRSGISIFDRQNEGIYFDDIEEAIVAKLTRKLYQKEVRDNPLYKDEIEKTDKIKEWLRKSMEFSGIDSAKQQTMLDQIAYIPESEKILEVLEGGAKDDYKMGYLKGTLARLLENKQWITLGRYQEEGKLDNLMQEIFDKSNGKFSNKEEIFVEFAKANFSGNLLPLARIIESALGKGSFRKIAETSITEND